MAEDVMAANSMPKMDAHQEEPPKSLCTKAQTPTLEANDNDTVADLAEANTTVERRIGFLEAELLHLRQSRTSPVTQEGSKMVAALKEERTLLIQQLISIDAKLKMINTMRPSDNLNSKEHGKQFDTKEKPAGSGPTDDSRTQRIEIMRVPLEQWRDVKKDYIDTKLPTLIVGWKNPGKGSFGGSDAKEPVREEAATKISEPQPQTGVPKQIPYRLAINSESLLDVLERISSITFPNGGYVWVRPFKYLMVYQKEIRQTLAKAESICKALVDESLNCAAKQDEEVQGSTTGHLRRQCKARRFG